MKKLFLLITLLPLVFLLALNSSITVFALAPIDTQRKGSLSITYKTADRFFENLDIKTYRIANISETSEFELCNSFENYAFDINLSSTADYMELTSTIESYIIADNISPDYTSKTDKNGCVKFNDITAGLYFTLKVQIDSNTSAVVFESFLSIVPSGEENDNYDVSVYPKAATVDQLEELVKFKVVKMFKDSGFESKRPKYIEVDIYKNGVLDRTEKLSSENNWCYTWTAPADNSQWYAVERNIPENYNVSITTNNNTISIINTYTDTDTNTNTDTDKSTIQTGDIILRWPLMVICCFSGGIILIISIWMKKEKQ